MDHTKNLKIKMIRVMVRYHFRLETFKRIPNKMNFVEDFNEFLINYFEGLVQREVFGISMVTNKANYEAGK